MKHAQCVLIMAWNHEKMKEWLVLDLGESGKCGSKIIE